MIFKKGDVLYSYQTNRLYLVHYSDETSLHFEYCLGNFAYLVKNFIKIGKI